MVTKEQPTPAAQPAPDTAKNETAPLPHHPRATVDPKPAFQFTDWASI